jgi:hypothetical protein
MLAASVLVLLSGLVFGVLLAAKVRVPPVLVGLLVTLPVVVAANASLFVSHRAAELAADQVPMGARAMLYAQTMQSSLSGWSYAAPAVLGIFALLLGSATGAVRASNKAPGLALIPFLLGGAMLLGLLRDRLLYFESFGSSLLHWTILPILVLLSLMTAVAFVGTDAGSEERSAGFESAAAAGLGLLGAVLALQVGALGASWTLIFDALGAVSSEMYPTMLANAVGVVAPESQRGLATAAWAAAIALSGIGIGATATGARRVGAVSALPCALLGPLLLLAADPTPSLLAYEDAQRQQFHAAPSKDYQLAVGTTTGPPATVPRGTVLRVTRRAITLDGDETIRLQQTVDRFGAERVSVPANALSTLPQRLEEERERWSSVPGATVDDKEARRLVLQVDKRTPWSLLGPILRGADSAGYRTLELALLTGSVIPRVATGEPPMQGIPVVKLGVDRMHVAGSEGPIPFDADEDDPAVRAALIAARDRSGGDAVVLVPDADVSWDQLVVWMAVARFEEPLDDREPWRDGTPLFPTVWLAEEAFFPRPETAESE